MQPHQFSFTSFLIWLGGRPLSSSLLEINAEIRSVESRSHSVAGAVSRRSLGSLEYTGKLRALLNFLYTHRRPGSLNTSDFYAIKPLARQFVQSGELPSDALAAFNEA